MKILDIFLVCVLSLSCWAVTDSMVVYNTDGVVETNRPIGFGRIFVQGEIANFPQVLVDGAPVATWQENVKNIWADTSVKYAHIDFISTVPAPIAGSPFTLSRVDVSGGSTTYTGTTAACAANACVGVDFVFVGFDQAGNNVSVTGANITASTSTTVVVNTTTQVNDIHTGTATSGIIIVTFQNSVVGSHTGGLSQAGMTGFNSGNWDGQIIVNPTGGGSAVTTSAKTILAASDPGANTYGDCKNNYWLQGPVVTAVILQDCTSTSIYDFGWTWNGTTMTSPVTGNASHASLHPMFIAYFYPSTNSVQIEEIMELPWSGRAQDQLADLTYKTEDAGGTLQTRWTRSGARGVTDAVVSGFTHNSAHDGVGNAPVSTSNVASATANFTSGDVGNPICVQLFGQFECGFMIALVNSSNVTVRWAADQGSPFSGSGVTAYIDMQSAFSRRRKVFWSGTAPGHVRIDHNFLYLISTKAIVNYDQTISGANPDHGYYQTGKCCGGWAYADWANSTDRGELGGNSGWESGYVNVMEGAPLQRADLLYLYNMGVDCGTPNGKCAKAWDILTGEVDTNASTTLVGVNGGGGYWFNQGNVPFHMRESRTVANGGNQSGGHCFYVSQFENKNALGNATLNSSSTSCLGGGDGNVPDPTGPNNATGKTMSRHAHSTAQFVNTSIMPIAAVGTIMIHSGGWDMGEAYYHWLDFAYLPYLLTGSPYYLEEEYFGSSYTSQSFSGIFSNYGSGGIFSVATPSALCARCLAWTLQSNGHAAYIAPDGSAEASYYQAVVNSNFETVEGMKGIVGTTVTPTDTSCSGSTCSYNSIAANRWNWGRGSIISQCLQTTTSSCTTIPIGLHAIQSGGCPVSGQPDVNGAIASTSGVGSQYTEATNAISHLREMGFSVAAAVDNDQLKFYLERILDSTYNPFLIATGWNGIRTGTGACVNSTTTDPFISDYATYLLATVVTERSAADFDATSFPQWSNVPCDDHGYSLTARGATSFAQEFGISSSDANCPSGTCTAAAAWSWVNIHVPYFTVVPPTGTTVCSVKDAVYTTQTDRQIKFAFSPRAPTSTLAAQPVCSPGSGTYAYTQSVSCTEASFGAEMCYTTNGTTPVTDTGTGCTTGTKYSGTISVPTTETLKIVGGGTGYTDSSVASYNYTITPLAVSGVSGSNLSGGAIQ